MAQIPNGILGELIGKIGPVTGYKRHGRNIVRPAKNNVKDKLTPQRLAQREKIKICNNFTKAFAGTGFFTKTFPAYGHGGSGYNRAMSALMNLALVSSYPALSISYPQVLISKGPLPSPDNALAAADADGNIQFTWNDNSTTGTAKGSDKVIIVAYFPSEEQAIFTVDAGTRTDGQATLPASVMKGFIAETWIGFLSADEKDAANSVYAGKVDL